MVPWGSQMALQAGFVVTVVALEVGKGPKEFAFSGYSALAEVEELEVGGRA